MQLSFTRSKTFCHGLTNLRNSSLSASIVNTSTSNLSTSNLSQSNLSTSEITVPSSHNYRFKNKFKSKHRNNNNSSSRGVTISPEKNIITIKSSTSTENDRVPKRQISHSFHNLSSSKESLFQKFKPQNHLPSSSTSSSSIKLSRPRSFLEDHHSSNNNNENREDIEEIYQTITSISQNKARQVQSQFKRRLAPPLHISNPHINHDSSGECPKGILKSNSHLAQVNGSSNCATKHHPPISINSVDPRILPDPRISTSSVNLTENSKSLLSEDDDDDDEEGETTTIYDSTSNVVIKVTQAKMKRVTLKKKSSFTDKSKLDRKHKKVVKREKQDKISRSSPNLYKNGVKSLDAAVIKHNNVVIKQHNHDDDAVVKPNLKNSQNPRRSDSGASSIDKTTTTTCNSDKTSSTGSLLDDGSYRSRDKNNNNSDSGANSDFDASTFDKYKNNDAKFYYQNNNNTFETNQNQHQQLYFDKISHPSSLQKSYSTTTAPPTFSKKFVITPEMLQNIQQQQQQQPKKLNKVSPDSKNHNSPFRKTTRARSGSAKSLRSAFDKIKSKIYSSSKKDVSTIENLEKPPSSAYIISQDALNEFASQIRASSSLTSPNSDISGITVEPDKNALGLAIRSIIAGGAVYKSSQLQIGDVINSINSESVIDMNQAQARNLIRHHSLLSKTVNLEYISKSDVDKLKSDNKKKRYDNKGYGLASKIVASQQSIKNNFSSYEPTPAQSIVNVNNSNVRILKIEKDAPSLGMTIVGGKNAKMGGLPPGIYVKDVRRGSPAAVAGIKMGDRIVSVSKKMTYKKQISLSISKVLLTLPHTACISPKI